MQNDIYSISGRVKNHISSAGITLSQVGTVLVNYFTLTLKELYDFSDTLPEPQKEVLNNILERNERVPKTIISIANPEPGPQFFKVRCWDSLKEEIHEQTVELDYIIECPFNMNLADIGLIAINQLRKQKGLNPIPKEITWGGNDVAIR